MVLLEFAWQKDILRDLAVASVDHVPGGVSVLIPPGTLAGIAPLDLHDS